MVVINILFHKKTYELNNLENGKEATSKYNKNFKKLEIERNAMNSFWCV